MDSHAAFAEHLTRTVNAQSASTSIADLVLSMKDMSDDTLAQMAADDPDVWVRRLCIQQIRHRGVVEGIQLATQSALKALSPQGAA